LISDATYLKLLAKTIHQVLQTPGRQSAKSVAQSSFDAWIKYYRPDENSVNATVSYYTKGSLVALCLDLSLRHEGVRTEAEKVGIITLNRPKQLNALNDQLMDELGRPSKPLMRTTPSDRLHDHHRQRKSLCRRGRHRRHGQVQLCRCLQGRLHHPQLGTPFAASANR
jgi:hypothetical protein